jgi:pimeloyl-ACP methyl ester carboxylesterase
MHRMLSAIERTRGVRPRAEVGTTFGAAAWLLCALASCGGDTEGRTGVEPMADAAASDAGSASPDAEAIETVSIDRSGLADVGTEPGLDYGDPRLWLCRPGNAPDECDVDLDATELKSDGTRLRVAHHKAENPPIDCFYVYPTVKLTSAGPMTDFANIGITLDPLLAQAARFSEVCKMYAPLYRQNGVVPGAGGAPMTSGMTSFALGAADVRDAFAYYLAQLNHGRKFVLIGHSQGTGMLTQMMVQDVDPKPEVRARMLSALLIGGGIAVPESADVGGTFKNIPLCKAAGQTGCVISYVSFSSAVPPGASATFGRSPGPGQIAGCTEPAVLAGRAGQRYRGSYVMLKRKNPSLLAPDGADKLPTDLDTPFIVYREVFRGTCKRTDTHSYLEIASELEPGDMRMPPYRYPAIEASLGLHLLDYAFAMDDLIEAVRLQAAAR